MLNQITVMGRLTRDPELRHTENNTPVCSFAIACDRDYANSNNERETDFFDIVAWRKTGEFAEKYFKKGQMITIVGRLQIRSWEDKEGNKRRTAEIVAASLYFSEAKKGSDNASAANTSSGTGDVPDGFIPDLDDEDLPF